MESRRIHMHAVSQHMYLFHGGIWQAFADEMGSDLGCHMHCAEARFDKDGSDGPISPGLQSFMGIKITGLCEKMTAYICMFTIQKKFAPKTNPLQVKILERTDESLCC